MQESLLFVCAANVCRSPLLEAAYAGAGTTQRVDVASAGVAVTRAAAMCEAAASMVPDDERERASDHRARSVDTVSLETQTLVLAASLEERGALALAEPSLRDHLFTVREALLLGEAPASSAEAARADAAVADGTSPLAAYARLLDGRRGRVQPPAERSWGWRRRARTNPLDIPDVHHERSHTHVSTLQSAAASARELRRRIDAWTLALQD